MKLLFLKSKSIVSVVRARCADKHHVRMRAARVTRHSCRAPPRASVRVARPNRSRCSPIHRPTLALQAHPSCPLTPQVTISTFVATHAHTIAAQRAHASHHDRPAFAVQMHNARSLRFTGCAQPISLISFKCHQPLAEGSSCGALPLASSTSHSVHTCSCAYCCACDALLCSQ